MRKRDQAVIDFFLDELSRNDLETAKLLAGKRMGWKAGVRWGAAFVPMSDRTVLKKVNIILGRADVVEAMRDVFEVAAKFTPVEAARTLVDHIRGNIMSDRKIVTKDGEVVSFQVKLDPSLDALKAYNSLTVPKPVKQIQVDTRMLVAHQTVQALPPGMRARVLPSTDAQKELSP